MRGSVLIGPLALASLVQGQPGFITTYGGMLAQDAVGVAPLAGGQYGVVVRHFGTDGRYRTTLNVCDATGNPVSTEDLDINGPSFAQALATAPGGDHYVVGSAFTPGSADHNGWIARLSPGFAPIWSVAQPQDGSQQYLAVDAMPGGGAVVCGIAKTGIHHAALVARFGVDGTLLWTTVIPGSLDVEAKAVATDASGIMVTGRQVNFGGTSDAWFARLDLHGNVQWTTAWGGAGNDEGAALVRAVDGHFVMAGHTNSFGPEVSPGVRRNHLYAIKIDTQGDTVWTRTIGEAPLNSPAQAIVRAANGDLLLAGWKGHAGSGNACVTRLSNTGQFIWQRTYDTGKEERLLSIRNVTDGFVAGGWSFGSFGRDVLLMKRNAQRRLSPLRTMDR